MYGTRSKVLTKSSTCYNATKPKTDQANQRQFTRLPQDVLLNLHELTYNLGDFVHKIITYPDLVVVCGLKTIFFELDNIIMAKSKHPVLLSYNTTYKLGDFYVSMLFFKHVLLAEVYP